MSTVAVDFDGVIHAYSKGWYDGTIYDEPIPGAFDALRDLMTRYAVFIHTTRDVSSVAVWVELRSGIPVEPHLPLFGERYEFWNDRDRLLVSNMKLPAVAYIDDRAIRFDNWNQALDDLDQATS